MGLHGKRVSFGRRASGVTTRAIESDKPFAPASVRRSADHGPAFAHDFAMVATTTPIRAETRFLGTSIPRAGADEQVVDQPVAPVRAAPPAAAPGTDACAQP